MWSAKERTIIARTKQYLEESYSVKVEVEELEELLGPDDVDEDARRILKEASDAKGCATFETFSSDGLSEFLVASRSRWDKYKRKWNAPWRQNSSASASEGWVARRPGTAESRMEFDGKRFLEAVEDNLEHCAHVKGDLDVLESLMEPENLEVSRYVLKY